MSLPLPGRSISSSLRPASAKPESLKPAASKLTPRGLQFETLEIRATPTIAQVETQIIAELMEQAPRVMPEISTDLSLLGANGKFSDLSYVMSTDAGAVQFRTHAARIEALEIAYKWNDASNPYHHDAALKAKVMAAWTYTAGSLGPMTAPNWWHKQIGTPQVLATPLILFHSELSTTTINTVLTKYFGQSWTNLTGANMASQGPPALIQGILTNNASRVQTVVSALSSEVVGMSGEGIGRDQSFLQHGSGSKWNFASGSYGTNFAVDVDRLMRWTQGTEFAFTSASIDAELRFVLDHLQYLTRGDNMDVAAMGRSVTRDSSTQLRAQQVYDATVDLLKLGRRMPELMAAVDRYEHGVNDTNFLAGDKSLWVTDGLLHSREDITATLKMISTRSLRPETAAGENKKGYFEGDGMLMLLQDGDEYGELGEQEIFPAWDWQELPGTTIQHNGVIPNYDAFGGGTNSSGSSNLVGSASDGQYGVAMMDYKRTGVTLTARKSWFFFDDEIIALGADIDDAAAKSPVFTTLNQVLLDGDVTVSDAAGRRTFGLGGSATLQGKSWIEQDHMGYVNLDSSSKLTVQAATQTGDGVSLPVFSAVIDHGTKVQNATYAYAMVPDKSADEVEAYTNNLPFTVLSNTANLQAVRHNGLNQTQASFFAAGSLYLDATTKITVTQPCNLIIKQNGDQLTITAADPRQLTTPIVVEINRQVTGSGATWNATTKVTKLSIALPAAPNAGSSATKTFTLGAPPVVDPPPTSPPPTNPPPTNPPPSNPTPVNQPVVYDATTRTLTIAGTPAGDQISVGSDSAGKVTVRINSASYGPFTNVAKVVAFGQAGNDTIMALNLPIPVEFYGNDGNDTLYGGSAADLLVGGAGDDNVYGYGGSDLLIGGGGRDSIMGDVGNDLLIGGQLRLAPDNFLPAFTAANVGAKPWSAESQSVLDALSAALAAWLAAPQAMPTQLGTVNTDFLTDSIADSLFAGAGNDWFYAAVVQKDSVLDAAAGDRTGEL
ncbi:polysaccharide lyase family 8 super-sandwich domain-containing protein [Anatilimnocola floriformis]|uniref:polysaccharide lyase family 8 super-sandwich domain-containing protein n=1 Tax=Anatilimnocola floriformis TaxID=2948575 RepID=UPI0020C55AEB|nr:polysaccharide lyase family 8 super-sandwich domain-containing protein [Anatilimnocola floriformis]